MIIHEALEQGSEKWLQIRKGRATASEAGNILTPNGAVSKSSLKYMRKLARECVIDDPHVFMGNKHTEWGNEHEEEAREMLSSRIEKPILEYGFCTRKDGIIGFSPDGLHLNNEIVNGFYEPLPDDFGSEFKCPSVDKHVEYLMGGILPHEHKLQVHWSMAASGIKKWYFMSYFPNLNPFIIEVHADDFTERVKLAQDQFIIDYAPVREEVLKAIIPSQQSELEMVV